MDMDNGVGMDYVSRDGLDGRGQRGKNRMTVIE